MGLNYQLWDVPPVEGIAKETAEAASSAHAEGSAAPLEDAGEEVALSRALTEAASHGTAPARVQEPAGARHSDDSFWEQLGEQHAADDCTEDTVRWQQGRFWPFGSRSATDPLTANHGMMGITSGEPGSLSPEAGLVAERNSNNGSGRVALEGGTPAGRNGMLQRQGSYRQGNDDDKTMDAAGSRRPPAAERVLTAEDLLVEGEDEAASSTYAPRLPGASLCAARISREAS